MLNEMPKQKASKFAVLFKLLMYVNLEQGIRKGKKIKVKSHEIEKQNILHKIV